MSGLRIYEMKKKKERLTRSKTATNEKPTKFSPIFLGAQANQAASNISPIPLTTKDRMLKVCFSQQKPKMKRILPF